MPITATLLPLNWRQLSLNGRVYRLFLRYH